MKTLTLKQAMLAIIGLSGLAATTASADAPKTQIAPYLEYEQVVTSDFNGDGDVLTYSTVAAGVDATVTTKRVQAQISYRYERRIAWDHHLDDDEVHSGIAQARVDVASGVSLEGGAIAARARTDGRGPAFGFDTADNRNIAQVYGAYAGPTVATHVGELAVNGSYRLGYVKVDDHSLAGLPKTAGQPLDRYDSSLSHDVEVSVGMKPGPLPVGWTLGAGYTRENVDRLKQRYQGKYVRGDLVLPVTSSLAVTGGVGYEKIRAGQQDIVRNPDGTPAFTAGGHLIGDGSKPRLLAYDQDGIIWDAGVIYRPSRRTELQARVGHRYGGTTVTGSLDHQFSDTSGVSAVVYDSVSSFGRSVVSDLNGLPVNFNVNHNPLSNGIGSVGGCVFGTAGKGGCFDNAFNAISTANYRDRGVTILFSGGRGPWTMGIGGGYENRKYLAPASTSAGDFTLDGVTDDNYFINGYLSRQLSRSSSLNFDAYASWYDSGVPGSDSSFGAGISASYNRTLFLDHMQGYASIGLYRTDSDSFDATSASALLGLRYTF